MHNLLFNCTETLLVNGGNIIKEEYDDIKMVLLVTNFEINNYKVIDSFNSLSGTIDRILRLWEVLSSTTCIKYSGYNS